MNTLWRSVFPDPMVLLIPGTLIVRFQISLSRSQ